MEQRSLEESSEWVVILKDVATYAEQHPLGVLVVFLLVAIVWLVRRLDRTTKDREQIAHALLHAQEAGHDIDETTARVLSTLDRRSELDRKIDFNHPDMRNKRKQ